MKRSFHALAIGVALIALCAACTISRVAEQFGEAQRENVARMTADPGAAERNLESPSGLDPLTAEKVIERYEKRQGESGEEREMPSFIQIGTGSGR